MAAILPVNLQAIRRPVQFADGTQSASARGPSVRYADGTQSASARGPVHQVTYAVAPRVADGTQTWAAGPVRPSLSRAATHHAAIGEAVEYAQPAGSVPVAAAKARRSVAFAAPDPQSPMAAASPYGAAPTASIGFGGVSAASAAARSGVRGTVVLADDGSFFPQVQAAPVPDAMDTAAAAAARAGVRRTVVLGQDGSFFPADRRPSAGAPSGTQSAAPTMMAGGRRATMAAHPTPIPAVMNAAPAAQRNSAGDARRKTVHMSGEADITRPEEVEPLKNKSYTRSKTLHDLGDGVRGITDGAATWAVGDRMRMRPQATINVSVIAPGGGTGANAKVYQELSRRPGFQLQIMGAARTPYDRYPPSFGENGCPPPNLQSFGNELLQQGIVENSTCIVCGSRGGQVVVPELWAGRGDDVPPIVCINGGFAMGLPFRVDWPVSAVTFLLLGGQDYFRGQVGPLEWLAEAKSRVPRGNGTTAIILANEMAHMPHSDMLNGLLHLMISAVVSWKNTGDVPCDQIDAALTFLTSVGFNGRCLYTSAPDVWEDYSFSPHGVAKR